MPRRNQRRRGPRRKRDEPIPSPWQLFDDREAELAVLREHFNLPDPFTPEQYFAAVKAWADATLGVRRPPPVVAVSRAGSGD